MKLLTKVLKNLQYGRKQTDLKTNHVPDSKTKWGMGGKGKTSHLFLIKSGKKKKKQKTRRNMLNSNSVIESCWQLKVMKLCDAS